MSAQQSTAGSRGLEQAQGAEHPPELLSRAEVAALFGVSPRTVTGWADGGRLETIRTLGGHRRYASAQVHAVLERQRRQVGPDAPGPDDER